MLVKIHVLELHAGAIVSMGGGVGVLDGIKSKGLVLMSYTKKQCPYEKAEEGAAVYLSSPANVRTQVAVCEAQNKPLKNPESAGTFIFTAGLLSLWYWDFCCCKSCSLKALSLPPPVLFLLSFLCIGYQVSTKVFC